MPYIPLPEPQIIKTEDGTIYLFFGEKFGWFDKDGFFNFNNLLKRSESLSSINSRSKIDLLSSPSESFDKLEDSSLSSLIHSLQYSDSSCTTQDVRFVPVDPDIADKFRQRLAEIKEKYGDRFTLVDPNPPRVMAPKSIEPLKNINNHQSK